MKVVIVGAGEVGFHIADRLSREGHDVTVVEKKDVSDSVQQVERLPIEAVAHAGDDRSQRDGGDEGVGGPVETTHLAEDHVVEGLDPETEYFFVVQTVTAPHANNANQALDRIINFFPEDRRDQLFMDLSLNLRAIVAQQLVRRPDGKSRRPVVEVLINTPLAADLIRKGEVHKLKELMKRSTEHGMITFDQALYDAFRRGEISEEDALRHADSSNEVRLMIKLGDTSPNALNRDIGKIGLSD